MRIKLLDHGYLELIEAWGSDERIIEAARQSTQKGFQGWGPVCVDCVESGKLLDPQPQDARCATCGCGGLMYSGDEKLLRFLWENAHSTPFEFAGAVVEVQAPLCVFREWHRHRTQSYSEASARYAPLLDINYTPTIARLMSLGGWNKQAGAVKGAPEVTPDRAHRMQHRITRVYETAQLEYEALLAEGCPKELARLVLPVGRYSRMRATANLRNWLAFLTLREAPNAQEEIRVYAHALHGLLRDHFPRTLALFEERK